MDPILHNSRQVFLLLFFASIFNDQRRDQRLKCLEKIVQISNPVEYITFWTSTKTETDGSTLATSSTTRATLKKLEPVPPYCGSISSPISLISETIFNVFK